MIPTSSELPFALHTASELQPQPVRWLWPGRLPLGKLAILDGDPGLGKSLLTLDLCARLSSGRPFPDHTPPSAPAPALILNGEDGASDTIRPRLQALGADLDRIYVLDRVSDDGLRGLSLPRHAAVLHHALEKSQSRLLVIDPIVEFLGAGVSVANDQSIRRALAPLAHLASRFDCAVLLVRHLTKGGNFQSIYRGGGSIGIVGACRAAWLVARDPYEPERRVFAQVKNNLAGPQPSLAYQVAASSEANLTLHWLGESPWTGDQLLAAAAKVAAMTALERAKDFLASTLAKGPLTSRELWPRAQKQKLSKRTMKRAKRDLEIRSLRVWADGKRLSYWLLPGQNLPDTIPPDDVECHLEDYLAPLREKYAGITPLDDV